ncbi:MAG: hypothetical protein Q4D98_06980, partial [Planctomycetia bacterium]|nr:hypothetical protein [Planctomycetia bacterium]
QLSIINFTSFWEKIMIRGSLPLLLCLCVTVVYGETPLTWEIPSSYFLKNTIQPEKGQTFRQGILRTQKEFDTFFGPAAVMFSNQKFLPEDYFEKNAILFFAEWGNIPWEYQVVRTVQEGDILRIFYSKTGTPSSAEYASFFLRGISQKNLTPKTRLETQCICPK